MTGAADERFRERLKFAIGTSTAFAQRSGFNDRTLRRWLSGPSGPSPDELADIARLTGRRVGWFFGEDVAETPSAAQAEPPADVALIPMVDARAAAGHGAFSDRTVEIGRVPFPLDWLDRLGVAHGHADRLDFIRVSPGSNGESMEPTIAPGALLLIDRGQTTIPEARRKKRRRDDDIFVFILGRDLRVKRLARHKGGLVTIVSDNAAEFPPEALSFEESAHLKPLGRVIWWDNRL